MNRLAFILLVFLVGCLPSRINTKRDATVGSDSLSGDQIIDRDGDVGSSQDALHADQLSDLAEIPDLQDDQSIDDKTVDSVEEISDSLAQVDAHSVDVGVDLVDSDPVDALDTQPVDVLDLDS